MRELTQLDMFSRITVSDFLLEKDALFARITLSSDELHLYQQIYDTLRPQAPRPDLVIYLQAAPEVLSERVRLRAEEFERGISAEYLTLLAESYSRFFYHYNSGPVLIVNSERLNFAKEERGRMDMLCDAMASAFPLLAKGDGVGFMNKVSLLVPAAASGLDDSITIKSNDKE